MSNIYIEVQDFFQPVLQCWSVTLQSIANLTVQQTGQICCESHNFNIKLYFQLRIATQAFKAVRHSVTHSVNHITFQHVHVPVWLLNNSQLEVFIPCYTYSYISEMELEAADNFQLIGNIFSPLLQNVTTVDILMTVLFTQIVILGLIHLIGEYSSV